MNNTNISFEYIRESFFILNQPEGNILREGAVPSSCWQSTAPVSVPSQDCQHGDRKIQHYTTQPHASLQLTPTLMAILLLSTQVWATTRTERPYQFSYQVEDRDRGLQYEASQTSDGRVVTGQYMVLLPGARAGAERTFKRSDPSLIMVQVCNVQPSLLLDPQSGK